MRAVTDLTWLTYLYRDLPWMVVRLEKTDRSFSCLGHDWMFKISDNKTDENRLSGFIFNRKMYLMHYRRLERCVKTCYLPDGAEHLQLFGIQRWNIFELISAGNKKARHETNRISEIHQATAGDYPRIPVTRKWRLPWILVQLTKLSMLLESTVCLCSGPVPLHTAGMDTHQR